MQKLIFTLLLSLFFVSLHGQTTPQSAVKVVDQEQWQKATKGMDFSRDLPEPPKPQPDIQWPEEQDWTALSAPWAKGIQIIAVILAFLAIAYGIFRMMQAPANKMIARDGVEITLENLEDYLHESDLERFLREAKARGDFSQAIRLYYLQIIKKLSEKKIVNWSRDKTNRDYLLEMRKQPQFLAFKNATLHYERVWYGNLALNVTEFERLEPDFQQLLTQI